MTKSLTGSIFLNISPNELILFPTSLKFHLVYFKIYLKIFETTFCSVFEIVLIQIYFQIGFLGERRNFQKFGEHPAFPHIEGKHSESRHNIFGVIVDAFITPPHFEGLVISCDMIICMDAY